MAIKVTIGGISLARAIFVSLGVLLPLAANARPMRDLETAQLDLRPPADVPAQNEYRQDSPQLSRDLPSYNRPPQNEGGADASSLLLRIDRLENQLRQMTGQMEEMKHRQSILEQKLLSTPENSATKLSNQPRQPSPTDGDAFDPSAHPNAIGAPHPLGRAGRDGTDIGVANAPLPLSDDPNAGQKTPFGRPLGIDSTAGGTTAPSTPRQQFEAALTLYKQGRYADAETGFSGLLAAHPKGALNADSIFYLGESFFRRHLNRQAAEQYLKLSTDYSKSAKAPEGLVRLGMSLNAMGAKEQACAALSEVARKYPKSAASIREAQAEAARDHC